VTGDVGARLEGFSVTNKPNGVWSAGLGVHSCDLVNVKALTLSISLASGRNTNIYFSTVPLKSQVDAGDMRANQIG